MCYRPFMNTDVHMTLLAQAISCLPSPRSLRVKRGNGFRKSLNIHVSIDALIRKRENIFDTCVGGLFKHKMARQNQGSPKVDAKQVAFSFSSRLKSPLSATVAQTHPASHV